jgi:DDE superfamily endonuclease
MTCSGSNGSERARCWKPNITHSKQTNEVWKHTAPVSMSKRDARRGVRWGAGDAVDRSTPFKWTASRGRKLAYRTADRVFWVVDSGSSHRGETSTRRLIKAHLNVIVVHTPVHASWLNQVEIYFSSVRRKVLTPNEFASLDEVIVQARFCKFPG